MCTVKIIIYTYAKAEKIVGFTSLGGYYKVLYGETLGKSRIP